jgi:hypothetical protein
MGLEDPVPEPRGKKGGGGKGKKGKGKGNKEDWWADEDEVRAHCKYGYASEYKRSLHAKCSPPFLTAVPLYTP